MTVRTNTCTGPSADTTAGTTKRTVDADYVQLWMFPQTQRDPRASAIAEGWHTSWDREQIVADDEAGLAEELARATWRTRLEALDALHRIGTLKVTVPTQRHIPKAFRGPLLVHPLGRVVHDQCGNADR